MNVGDLISKLGGPAKVGRACGVSTAAVSNWSAGDRVPAEHRLTMWRMATAAGLDWVPPGAEGARLVLPASEAAA